MAQYCDTCVGGCDGSNRTSGLGSFTRSRFTGGGALARILHNKYIKDEQLERMDKSEVSLLLLHWFILCFLSQNITSSVLKCHTFVCC